jgi:hypothetical protein
MARDTKVPLNHQVAEELKNNLELWLVFSASFSGYDWEIDPLHRPEWIKATKEHEAQLLEESKVKLETLKRLHEDLQIVRCQF